MFDLISLSCRRLGRRQTAEQTSRQSSTPHPCLRCPGLSKPLSWGMRNGRENDEGRCGALSPQTGLSSCAPGWAPIAPTHTPNEGEGWRRGDVPPPSPNSHCLKATRGKTTLLGGSTAPTPKGVSWGGGGRLIIHTPKYRPGPKTLGGVRGCGWAWSLAGHEAGEGERRVAGVGSPAPSTDPRPLHPPSGRP